VSRDGVDAPGDARDFERRVVDVLAGHGVQPAARSKTAGSECT
jgi:hypothetical protein